MSDTPRDPSIPASFEVLGEEYRLIEKLGEGAFGVVYRAHHELLDQDFAVKILKPELCEDESVRDRFLDEARALIRFSHANVVQIRHVGEHEGRLYLVMDLVRGEMLNDLLRRKGALPEARAVALTLQLLAGLEAAHAAGIVHRDLKPGNLILDQGPDGQDRLRILDFGLSKLTGDGVANAQRSVTGAIIGTLAYMSPEQLSGEKDIDPRSDVFAAGLILHEMLNGKHPYPGESGIVVAAKLLREPVPDIDPKKAAKLQDHVKAALRDALQRDRDARFSTAFAFAQGLEGGGPPTDTSRVTTIQEARAELARAEAREASAQRKKRGGTRRIVWVAGALVVVGAVAAFFALGQNGDSGSETGNGDGEPPSVVAKTPSGGGPGAPGETPTAPIPEPPVEPAPDPTPIPVPAPAPESQPEGPDTVETPPPPPPPEEPPEDPVTPTDATALEPAAPETPEAAPTEPVPAEPVPTEPVPEDPSAPAPEPAAVAPTPAEPATPEPATPEPAATEPEAPAPTEPPPPEDVRAVALEKTRVGAWAEARTLWAGILQQNALDMEALRGTAMTWLHDSDALARRGKPDEALRSLDGLVTWLTQMYDTVYEPSSADNRQGMMHPMGFTLMHRGEAHTERARWLGVQGDAPGAKAALAAAKDDFELSLQTLYRDGENYWDLLLRRAELRRTRGEFGTSLEDLALTTFVDSDLVPARMWVAHFVGLRRAAERALGAADAGQRGLAFEAAQQALQIAKKGESWTRTRGEGFTRTEWLEAGRVVVVREMAAPAEEDRTALRGLLDWYIEQVKAHPAPPWESEALATARLRSLEASLALMDARIAMRKAADSAARGRQADGQKLEAEARQKSGDALRLAQEAVTLREQVAKAGERLASPCPYLVLAYVLRAQGRASEADAVLARAADAARRSPPAGPLPCLVCRMARR